MTSDSEDSLRNRTPFLVLGLGNTLLGDDGFGPALIEQLLQEQERWNDRIEFLDGGTQGLALLGPLSGREAIIIVDALAKGAPPGTTKVLNLSEVFQVGVNRTNTSHEGNASELLAVAKVLDELPDRVFVVGVEPQNIATGYGLSEPARRALPIAASRVRDLLTELNTNLKEQSDRKAETTDR